MGTNFYIRGHGGNDDPKVHIGKRSAAGLYCWDCGITLCDGGNGRIHHESTWRDKCPECGAEKKNESLAESAAGRELGFNRSTPVKGKGVTSVCSFTWAMDPKDLPEAVMNAATECPGCHRPYVDNRPIEDEYGRSMTVREFEDMLEALCPIRFTDSIGAFFS